MYKRILSNFLVFAMLLAFIPAISPVAEASGSCGDDLSWSFDPSQGILKITGSGSMYDYSSYSNPSPWWDNRAEILSIEIGEGVTTLGEHAFFECTELQNVTLPDTLTIVGSSAFAHCSALTTLSLPEAISSIHSAAFYQCTSLSNISIPDKALPIGLEAFTGTAYKADPANYIDGLLYLGKHLIGAKGVTGECKVREGTLTIAAGAFSGGIQGATTVIIPDSVIHLGESAFNGCFDLTKVILSNGLTQLLRGTFMYCVSLKYIFIPESIEKIHTQAFTYCNALTDLYFYGDAPEIEERNFSTEPTLHYIEGKTGWSSPEWNGYRTALWDGVNFSPFKDVRSNDWFGPSVIWAVENGITNGTGDNSFSPHKPCTRGQIVTFLWRAKGSPEPQSTANPFTDVSTDAYYYQAVLWAVEQGITTGTGNGRFSPDATCTRGQAVTFLWRANGKQAPSSASTDFSDVSTNAYYYQAVLWAVENGITNGTGISTFSPDQFCTRAQIVTFLYRAK